MADRNELLSKRAELNREISQLKRELGDLSARKRAIFVARDGMRKQFMDAIGKIKQLRSKRDEHTRSVKELKEKRNTASRTAKKLLSELEGLRHEKDAASKKLGIRKAPPSLAGEIARMEYKIETEVMPFENEKKLTKLIKDKKAELKKIEQLSGVVNKIRESSKQLNPAKMTSEEAHQELQLHASVSQKLHEEMILNAKKADELKKQLKPTDNELKEIHEKMAALKPQLDVKLAELESLSGELGKLSIQEEQRKKEEKERTRAEKENELSEKIKSGKKLTMDDLIKLQDG